MTSLTEDLNSQSKVNESLERQLNETIEVRAAMKERISYLEGKSQQDEHVEPSSPQVEAHSDFTGEDEYNSAWAGGGIGPLSSDDEEEVADEAGKSNASSDQSDHEHPCKPTPCNTSQGQSNLHCKEGTLSGTDASSNGSSRSRNADDGVQETATGSSLSDVCDTLAPPEQAASETDTIEHNNSLEPEKNKDSVSDCSKSKSLGNDYSSPVRRKISSEARCEMVDASTDTNGSSPKVLAQMAVNAETSSEPSPHQENCRRGLRKRKAPRVYTPLMSTKENAERMQEKVETPKAKKNKKAKANTVPPGEAQNVADPSGVAADPTMYNEEEIVGCPFIEKGRRDRRCKVDVGGVQQGQHKSVQCRKFNKGTACDGMCQGHYRAFKFYREPTADPPEYTKEGIEGSTFIAKGSRSGKCKVVVNGKQCVRSSRGKVHHMCRGHYKAFKHFNKPTA